MTRYNYDAPKGSVHSLVMDMKYRPSVGIIAARTRTAAHGDTGANTSIGVASSVASTAKYPTHHHHHHRRHHHQSLNRQGRWGATDDFTTSFLHFSLFSTALLDLATPGLSIP